MEKNKRHLDKKEEECDIYWQTLNERLIYSYLELWREL